jgi:hypothetical protein
MYQKPMHLYTYIPPLSAHPKSCFKGSIIGKLLRYWHQNTDEADFININSLPIQRQINRGHPIQDIILILQKAASSIDNTITRISTNTHERKIPNTSNDTLYIHWKFHQLDITQQMIRQIYDKTQKNFDTFNKMTIALSRPKNLRDILCCTQLQPIPDNNVSDILKQLEENPTVEKKNSR